MPSYNDKIVNGAALEYTLEKIDDQLKDKVSKDETAVGNNIVIFSPDKPGQIIDSGLKISDISTGGITAPKFLKQKQTYTIGSNSFIRFTLPTGYPKYRLETVKVDTSANVQLELSEKLNDPSPLYISNVEPNIYDMTGIPFHDESDPDQLTGNIYGRIMNKDIASTTVVIELRMTSLS